MTLVFVIPVPGTDRGLSRFSIFHSSLPVRHFCQSFKDQP